MKYHDISKDNMLNGNGLRVVLWVSGCHHKCYNCQNKITWDHNMGVIFNDDAKKEIFDQLEKSYIEGITLSGGDPLNCNNIEEIKSLIIEIKERYPDKTIWLYTGYTWEELIKFFDVKDIDILIDGKYIENKRNTKLKWRGSSNQRVINVKETLKNDINNPILYCED